MRNIVDGMLRSIVDVWHNVAAPLESIKVGRNILFIVPRINYTPYGSKDLICVLSMCVYGNKFGAHDSTERKRTT